MDGARYDGWAFDPWRMVRRNKPMAAMEAEKMATNTKNRNTIGIATVGDDCRECSVTATFTSSLGGGEVLSLSAYEGDPEGGIRITVPFEPVKALIRETRRARP